MPNLLSSIRRVFNLAKDDNSPFWRKVKRGRSYECWEWTGDVAAISGFGISRKTISGVVLERVAHRLAYILTFGAVPSGHSVKHRCRNRLCCNPDHLIPMRKHEDPQEEAYINAVFYETKRSKFLSRFEKLRICQLKSEGFTVRSISDHFGVSKSTVFRVVKEDSGADI